MVTGSAALDHDVRSISAEDTTAGERRVLPLTLLVLVLAFGALVAATLPVMVGLLAITIALGLLTVLAHFWTMSVFVLNITTMVGLGVGHRLLAAHRHALPRGAEPRAVAGGRGDSDHPHRGLRRHDVRPDRRRRVRRAHYDAAHRDAVGRHRRAARGGDRRPAVHHVPSRHPDAPGTRHRPAALARPAPGPHSRPDRLGAVGALARPPALARHRHRRERRRAS